MNIILKEDVSSLGRLGDIVKVSGGYARNYLMPKGLAIEATPGNLRMWENEKKGIEKKLKKLKGSAQTLCEQLASITLSFKRKTGEDDKLFGSVTSMDIADYLREMGFDIDRKNIHLPEPIKIIGEHTVPVKLHHDVTANIKVSIVKE